MATLPDVLMLKTWRSDLRAISSCLKFVLQRLLQAQPVIIPKGKEKDQHHGGKRESGTRVKRLDLGVLRQKTQYDTKCSL